MAKKIINNIKLGVFVLAGLFFLILLLYMISKNRHLFGSSFVLKAQFQNVQGLKAGNNVRYAGIEIGTVKQIDIVNDTLMEVQMIIDKKMQNIIRSNALVAIGTDGLVGNKVVNITAAKTPAEMARDGDVLVTKKTVSADDMLETLNKTNTDIAVIADNLKMTVTRLNNSAAFWSLLSDPGLPADIKKSAANIQLATARAIFTVNDLNSIVGSIKNGNGSLGRLLTDTTVAFHLTAAVNKIDSVANEMYSVSKELNATMAGLHQDISNGKGTISVLLKDSALALNLSRSLDNIQQGTDGFNQNMEALKHNFLLRGYFKKLEKQQQQQLKKAIKKTNLYTTPAEKADKKNG